MPKALTPLVGMVNSLLVIVNTVFWCTPLYIVATLKLIIPNRKFRDACTRFLLRISENWVHVNSSLLALTTSTRWNIEGVEGLSPQQSYLIVSNHRSWVDIVVLQHIFNRRVPFIRFFVKQQLKWLPFLGIAFWALDFPFMKRYSKSYLERHPEKKGEDLKTTQAICRRVCHQPVSFVNFLEGTRFSEEKKLAKGSPYTHHLRPKAGGLAYILDALEGRLNTLLDVTIVYPKTSPSFFDLVSGKVSEIVVRVRNIPIPSDLLQGDYSGNPNARKRVQNWVNQLWVDKDAFVEGFLYSAEAKSDLSLK